MNFLRRLASLPGLRAVLLRPGVRSRLAQLLALRFLVAAWATTTPGRFLWGEATRRGEVAEYELRDAGGNLDRVGTSSRRGVPILVKHGRDVEAVFEIFSRGEYEPPAELAARVANVRQVLDVGANIGGFAAWARTRWPDAEIICVEPAPDSLPLLQQWAGQVAGVEVIAAAAACQAGEMSFVSGWGGGSHAPAVGSVGNISVPTVDVFPLLTEVDFVKLDIEGGEWAILADSRLGELHELTLVMEYHRHLAPSLPARAAAVQLLTKAGFEVGHGHANHWGHGTLWAWK